MEQANATTERRWKPKYLTTAKIFNDSSIAGVKIFGDIKLVEDNDRWKVYVNTKSTEWDLLGSMSIRKWEHNLDVYRRAARKFGC